MSSASATSTSAPATDSTCAIRCAGVWKQYYFHAHRPQRLKEAITSIFHRRPPAPDVWALRDFNLLVGRGETVGIVGNNGAGKSTLLKLLSRILEPTRGIVEIAGRLSSIIELGAGFHEELTGRENVYLAGSFLGLRRRQIDSLYGPIVEFADLAAHMDMPVKYYSSGMRARLGFALAVSVDPDILLIDEVLAVGDASFQPRCREKIEQFQRAGKAILFVSHDMTSVRKLCQRALWLKNGQTMAEGDANKVVDQYLEHYWPGSTGKKKEIRPQIKAEL